MKVIHLPFGYYPDPVGGTEIYVEALAQSLQSLGVSNLIAAPGMENAAYQHAGLFVRRYQLSAEPQKLSELYGEGDELGAQTFSRILDEECPDIVHLHAFTRGVSLRLLRAARERQIKTVFTYHTPTASCQRGTLMRWGREVCDGVLSVRRCTACNLHALGAGQRTANMLSYFPAALGQTLSYTGLSGGALTALQMSYLVQLRQRAFRDLMNEVDQVIALCQWTKELLTNNGVATHKITVSRHGLTQSVDGATPRPPLPNSPLRVAYLGRFDYTKGVDLLISAVRALPDLPIALDLYGVVQAGSESYAEHLRQLAASDARIQFLPPVASQAVIELLRSYHFLAVPSRLLETGPLVVLEAFAAGTPVLGSRLGGIAEWVRHGVNGLLAVADSLSEWIQMLRQCVEQRSLYAALRQGIAPLRSMKDVARDYLQIYERACA